MKQSNITLTANYKKTTTQAVFSIGLFVFTYITLLLLAIGLAILCGFLGVLLIKAKIHFFTIIIGVGVISMAFLVLIFLLKFMFKRHKIDRLHLTEIIQEEQPELFSMIEKVVDAVDTRTPKRVYLSADVNASVFYDSSFWSMFFPIKKNLQIGMGLVNSVTVTELEAILAHEFGHFSQSTMKVGSYVYNVNKVIYNMLYDNDSYHSIAQSIANIHAYVFPFVKMALGIVNGIQWILKKVYHVVNVNYMSLSREMEFQADSIAANTTGSTPLITSLMRMNLADYSYNQVIEYYNGRIQDNVVTENIFPLHYFVMNFLAKENKLSILHGFPKVEFDQLNRYNKSKLVIADQWASHPSTEDRVKALEMLNIVKEPTQQLPAMDLFQNPIQLQQQLTQKLFSSVLYQTPIVVEQTDQFIENFKKTYDKNSFSPLFNGYFDHKTLPSKETIGSVQINSNDTYSIADLFSDYAVDRIYVSIALQNDIESLKRIASKSYPIRTFDYDGVKYTENEAIELINILEKELEEVQENLLINDQNMYKFFYRLSSESSDKNEFGEYYEKYHRDMEDCAARQEAYNKMANASAFMLQNTQIKIIEELMPILKQTEKGFVTEVEHIMNSDLYRPFISKEDEEVFTKYLSRDWRYFGSQGYFEDHIQVFIDTMNTFQNVLGKTRFGQQKGMLLYMENLARKTGHYSG